MRTSKGKSTSDEPLVINGWQIFAHPLFLAQLDRLIAAVEAEAEKNPETYKQGANAKVLASIFTWAFENIPSNPADPMFRQGNTLGKGHKHWFRAKFGNQRFRLFFRYQADPKIIIFAWVNDANTKREYGAKSDAYAVFRGMLEEGNPPSDWDKLLKSCQTGASNGALARIRGLIHRFGR